MKAAASALIPGSIEYIETVHDIRLDHLDAAQKHILDPDILKRVQDEVHQDCDRLRAFLEAAQVKAWHCRIFAAMGFAPEALEKLTSNTNDLCRAL